MSELPWSPDEEPVVLAFLSGEIGSEDPRFRQLVSGRPEFEATLQELRGLESELDQLGGQERERRLAASAEEPDAASLDRAGRLLDAELPPRRRVLRFRFVAVAAAAVVLCVWGLRGVLDSSGETVIPTPPRPERVLGESEYEAHVVLPSSPQGPFDVFEWKRPTRPARAEIRFFSSDGPLLFGDRTDTPTSWRPTPEELEAVLTAASWSVWLERRGGPPSKWAEGKIDPR